MLIYVENVRISTYLWFAGTKRCQLFRGALKINDSAARWQQRTQAKSFLVVLRSTLYTDASSRACLDPAGEIMDASGMPGSDTANVFPSIFFKN